MLRQAVQRVNPSSGARLVVIAGLLATSVTLSAAPVPRGDSLEARLRFRACVAARRAAAVDACQAALAAGLGPQRAALAQVLLARAQAVLMNWDAVLVAQREALRLQPQDPEASHRVALTLLYAFGQAAQSEPYLRQAVELRRDAGTHVDLGVALSTLGRLEEARGEFAAALALDPAALDNRPAAAAVWAALQPTPARPGAEATGEHPRQ